MTTERWTDERLDQLANTAQSNTTAISELRATTSELRVTAEALLQTVVQHQGNFEVLVQEIRGLRAENRRILSHLFGEQSGAE